MKTRSLLLAFVIFSIYSIQAQIIHVPGDFPTIQQAIDAADNADTVLVQPGMYVENINFLGKDIVVGSLFLTTEDTAYVSQTIIDGDQNGTSVVTFEGEESQDAVLTGFTITNGNSSTSGGGIMCVYSNPYLGYLIIDGNSAEYNGGGIICGAYASPIIDNVIITENSSGADGGGIYCYNNCSPSIENVIISDNTAAYHGGGICCLENCSPNLSQVSITGNTADQGGGIFCAFNSNLLLQSVTLEDNSADQGGGIFMTENELTFIEAIITNNTAIRGGGIYCDNLSELNLSQTSINNNLATNRGAGIHAFNTRLYIEEGELTENEVVGGQGGAIYFSCGGDPEELPEVIINNTNISYNLGTENGSSSGIAILKPDDFPPFNVVIENCVFEANVSNAGTALRMTGNGLEFDIENCSFLSNEAVQYTAGVSITSGCTGRMVNCLFESNMANTGGGDWNSGALTLWNLVEANLFNCTFINNSAFYGSAITMFASEALLLNSIVWDNENNQITVLDGEEIGSSLIVGYCDVQGGEISIEIGELTELNWAEGNIDEDPVFVASGEHPYSLDMGSPCIDTGTPDTTGQELPPNDCVGNIRVWDGDGDDVAVIDMGSYEYGSIPVHIDETNVEIKKEIESIAFPNPFNTSTTLTYELKHPEKVTLTVYDHMGKQVYQTKENQPQGKQQLIWNAERYAEGVYYYRLQVGDAVANGKMVKVR